MGGTFAIIFPYVAARLKVYRHPELDLKGKGHQPYQAKIAAGSGQLFGKGPGNSLQKLSYLPEAQNDYIAAIYAEEFGFAGIAVLICLYTLLGCLGFQIAAQASTDEGFYYASAVTFLLCFQAFLNLGVVSGLLPSTGLNRLCSSRGYIPYGQYRRLTASASHISKAAPAAHSTWRRIFLKNKLTILDSEYSLNEKIYMGTAYV